MGNTIKNEYDSEGDLKNLPFRDAPKYLEIGGSKAYKGKKEVNGFNSSISSKELTSFMNNDALTFDSQIPL